MLCTLFIIINNNKLIIIIIIIKCMSIAGLARMTTGSVVKRLTLSRHKLTNKVRYQD